MSHVGFRITLAAKKIGNAIIDNNCNEELNQEITNEGSKQFDGRIRNVMSLTMLPTYST